MRFRLLCGFLLVCQLCFAATEKTVYSFSRFPHGTTPLKNVTFDSAGNIYGTTCFGGTHNDGTVFKLTPGKNGSYTQTVLYSFSGSDGACPASGVVLDSAGNIYGTASTGGNKSTTCFQTAGCGVVFKLTPNGTTWKQQILYKFSGSDASYPSSLAWYPGGNLVGTAGPPSPNWNGIVFMLTPSGTAWNFTTLFSFPATGFANGLVGPLVVDSSGNLYGVTTYGGTFNEGIVFELSYSGNQLVESVLHSFTRGGDGNSPTAGLSIDQAGNLYGSAPSGGTLGYGSIFKLTRDTQSNWNEAVIYNFQSVTDGWGPQGGVVLDGAGNVYGTTAAGGSTSCSCGTAFELSPNSNGAYTKKTIHNFSGYAGSQLGTLAAMVFDSQGNLYGTTPDGNGHLNVSDGGTVYRLSPGSSGWTYTVLYGFPASDGHGPGAGPTFDSAGNLYGTTTSGGLPEAGTVYELSPAGNGVWTEKLLYSFYGGNDGATPYSNIVIDSSGNLFGTTKYGGGGSSSGFGTVFELQPPAAAGGAWTETVLHSFTDSFTDGGNADSTPVIGGNGALYGTTYTIAGNGAGSVFRLTPPAAPGGTWTEDAIFRSGGFSGGLTPNGLTREASGALFGTTLLGGIDCPTNGCGVVFELEPVKGGTWPETILHDFTGQNGDGATPYPFSILAIGANGAIFGTTTAGGSAGMGVVFEIDR